LVIGANDPVPDRRLLERLAHDNDHVSLTVWPGVDHDLLLTDPDLALAELRAAMRTLSSSLTTRSGHAGMASAPVVSRRVIDDQPRSMPRADRADNMKR